MDYLENKNKESTPSIGISEMGFHIAVDNFKDFVKRNTEGKSEAEQEEFWYDFDVGKATLLWKQSKDPTYHPTSLQGKERKDLVDKVHKEFEREAKKLGLTKGEFAEQIIGYEPGKLDNAK